jgi:hypothetical protein
MNKNTGVCKLCDQEKPLCKSHIIPKAFFKDAMDDDNRGLIMFSNNRVEHGKMGGEYELLMCRSCESLVGKYDNYGVRFFRGELWKRYDKLNETTIPNDIHILGGVDIKKLRLFIISVLWRAGISSRQFYENVDLGPFAPLAKDIILENTDLKQDDFPCFISRYDEPHRATHIIMNPVHTRMGSVRFYNINFGLFNAFVKVDGRELPYNLGLLHRYLDDYNLVLVFDKPLTKSKEYETILRVAGSAYRSLQRR